MNKLLELVRPNIRNLVPYASARDEYVGNAEVYLDANENPYGALNRYPDPLQRDLKQRIAELRSCSVNQIFIGNGSDEVIDLLFRVFCQPGQDKVLTFTPTYGMYAVSAAINDTEVVEMPLDANFQIDSNGLNSQLEDPKLKLIFICSPNNPTGNLMEAERIEWILNRFRGLVIVDEAYIDFSAAESLVNWINRFPNLVIAQTFSKAWGLAGARLGMAFASEEIIQLLNKVKPPYNVSTLNQQAALLALNQSEKYAEQARQINSEKSRVESALNDISRIEKVYPSEANFLLVKMDGARTTYQNLIEQGIIVRDRSKQIKNCLRITIGTPTENDRLLNALQRLA